MTSNITENLCHLHCEIASNILIKKLEMFAKPKSPTTDNENVRNKGSSCLDFDASPKNLPEFLPFWIKADETAIIKAKTNNWPIFILTVGLNWRLQIESCFEFWKIDLSWKVGSDGRAGGKTLFQRNYCCQAIIYLPMSWHLWSLWAVHLFFSRLSDW